MPHIELKTTTIISAILGYVAKDWRECKRYSFSGSLEKTTQVEAH